MKKVGIAVVLGLLLLAAPAAWARQEAPTVLKDKLPKKAVCHVCSQNGEEHGEEKPAGAVAYRGKTYYFCSKGEVTAFVKNPEAYLPAPLPRPAPATTLQSVAGESVSLEELSKGRVLLVDFWATWCGPCIKAMPEVQRLHGKYSAAGGRFSAVGVSIDEGGAKQVRPFLAKQKTKYTYPMLLDTGETWTRWGVKSLPSMLLVKDGQVIGHWSGKVDLKQVERAVAGALASPATN